MQISAASLAQFFFTGNIFNRSLRVRIREAVPGIWWNIHDNCAKIIEKVNISKASLLLSANVNVDSFNIESGYSRFNGSFLLHEISAEIFDGLLELESSVPEDTKMVLVYIAGYITCNDSGSSEEKLLNETTFNYQKYGQYLDAMDRGGLNIPTDNTCQWSIFSFILFNTVKEKV